MNSYGVSGYLTPDDLPDESHCRTFRIPNDVQWLSVFMGALLPLIYPENWQKSGELTTEQAADVMLNVIWDAYANDFGECPVSDAPYWDDADAADADDEYAPDDQTWYGVLEPVAGISSLEEAEYEYTFIERVQDWAIAAFIAYAGSPGAAIAFLTIAPRFRLAWQAHDLGGIVDIFIDAAHIGRVDTYSPVAAVKTFDVIIPDAEPGDGGHMLWLRRADESPPESTVRVIKKRLDPNEVYPTNLRYNPATDEVEQTYDGGLTWAPNPNQDPRTAIQYLYPPVVALDPRCQSASNIVRFINNVIDDALTAIAEGLDALSFALILLPLLVELGPFAILFDLILALAFTLMSAGATALSAAFTNEVYDALVCIFFCALEPDGSATTEDVEAIRAQIESEIGGLVGVVMDAMLLLMGPNGVSNQGTLGDAPADCDACACGICEGALGGEGLGAWLLNPNLGVTECYNTSTYDAVDDKVVGHDCTGDYDGFKVWGVYETLDIACAGLFVQAKSSGGPRTMRIFKNGMQQTTDPTNFDVIDGVEYWSWNLAAFGFEPGDVLAVSYEEANYPALLECLSLTVCDHYD